MIGVRKGQAISQVNAAVSLTILDGRMSEARAAVGSVAPVPLRLETLEAFLSGKRVEDVSLEDIEGPILEGIRPIDDVRSSASYRQQVTVSLVFDAMAECAAQISEREGAGGC
jgi:CO/xanthine dehydrogenase FAD-binding subunit